MKNGCIVLLGLVLSMSAFAEEAKTETKKETKVAAKTEAKKTAKAEKNAEVMTLDVTKSTATWVGKKVTGSHTGTVSFIEGKFEVKKNEITGGEVVIDLNTIANTDLKDAEYNKKLVDHLKSDAFFDVSKTPTASFKINSFNEVHNFAPGEPNAIVKGTLTLHGITKPTEVKLFFTPSATGFDAKGKLMIDRTLYGIKYNSKKFFDIKTLGDKMIEDQFEVDLNLTAKK